MIETLASIVSKSIEESQATEIGNVSPLESQGAFNDTSSLSAFEQKESLNQRLKEAPSKSALTDASETIEIKAPETQNIDNQISSPYDINSHLSAFEQKDAINQSKELNSRDDLKTYSPEFSNYIDQLGERLNPDYFMKDLEFGVEADGKIIAKGTADYNRNSMIKIDGDKAFAKAGSLEGAGSLNEFINETVLMPDTTYNIDGRQVCKTDNLGRVVSSYAELHKPIDGIRYQQRDTHTQMRIVEDKDGILGHDDAGHLVPNRLGGPNEAINQVPMARELNRSGSLWFQTENDLSNAVREGKEVIVSDTLEYTGDSFRPDRIIREISIDGEKRTHIFDNPQR